MQNQIRLNSPAVEAGFGGSRYLGSHVGGRQLGKLPRALSR